MFRQVGDHQVWCAAGWSWETGDRLVISGPVLLLNAQLVASSAGASTATLYEGGSTDGRIIAILSAPTSEMSPPFPGAPIFCERGIYLDAGANASGVFLAWDHLKSP